ncbi:hypothetical protein [Umezawaea tangerina]|uniref:Phenylalanyl-tRNA synthetase alpha chain n=1 Tax=Umezawaea tangerina TaxID=84725 RepID=A0A2T0T4R5_9PSEU|nr:hypothetical protein [Umezawaea tangerina]PRY40675.1 phenylalanyl-tRNA synthetase alpha chain [Umezawaea tangerina]
MLLSRDLTDPAQGPHAIQLILDDVLAAVRDTADTRVVREDPVTTVADNYTNLGCPAEGSPTGLLLRTHTSAMVPPALRALAAEGGPWDVLLACPGAIYRDDPVDRLHIRAPHQLDLWWLGRTVHDVGDLVVRAVRGALPGVTVRLIPDSYPYVEEAAHVDVLVDGRWVEVGGCGRVARHVLDRAGVPVEVGGVALGLGLDRLLMVRKGVPDVRLLAAVGAAAQMVDLAPYRAV